MEAAELPGPALPGGAWRAGVSLGPHRQPVHWLLKTFTTFLLFICWAVDPPLGSSTAAGKGLGCPSVSLSGCECVCESGGTGLASPSAGLDCQGLGCLSV